MTIARFKGKLIFILKKCQTVNDLHNFLLLVHVLKHIGAISEYAISTKMEAVYLIEK
jgi:hypothetical protein